MAGVEILAMEEVVTNYTLNWCAFWIAFCVIFGGLIAVGISISIRNYDWSNLLIAFFLGIVFGTMFGVLFGTLTEIPTEYAMQYKVIVSDEVPMNEFVEKYEIVDQEGKIYTVIERE